MTCECASNSLPTNSSKLLALKTGCASRFPLVRTRCDDAITESLSKKAKNVNGKFARKIGCLSPLSFLVLVLDPDNRRQNSVVRIQNGLRICLQLASSFCVLSYAFLEGERPRPPK